MLLFYLSTVESLQELKRNVCCAPSTFVDTEGASFDPTGNIPRDQYYVD